MRLKPRTPLLSRWRSSLPALRVTAALAPLAVVLLAAGPGFAIRFGSIGSMTAH